jgi:hypothetical protein
MPPYIRRPITAGGAGAAACRALRVPADRRDHIGLKVIKQTNIEIFLTSVHRLFAMRLG